MLQCAYEKISTWYTSRSLSLEAPTTTHASSSPDGSSAITPSAKNTLTHIIKIRLGKIDDLYDNKDRNVRWCIKLSDFQKIIPKPDFDHKSRGREIGSIYKLT